MQPHTHETLETAMIASRHDMVARQLEARGIRDERVLDVMRRVPRELFVPDLERPWAYSDAPLPIGHRQTISQPFIVAFMIAALGLQGDEIVLEVGAGSGYAAAVLANLAARVFAVERIPELARRAIANLKAASITNVEVRCGDGSHGLAGHAPFDAILVSAGAQHVPGDLLDQLALGGRMVIPVGRLPHDQELRRIVRTGTDAFQEEVLEHVRFVPLIENGALIRGMTP